MITPDDYRMLADAEVEVLVRHGCTSADDDWGRVRVVDGFDPRRVSRVHFAGQVRIGTLQGETTGGWGEVQPAEIRDARLVDCQLGNNVRIVGVGLQLANYDVADGACIENVGTMLARPDASFGNGTEVEVLNEAGGREVILFSELSSQIAHLECLHRYRPALIESLQEISRAASRDTDVARGQVGKAAR